jgi:hypothetical protein
MLTVLLRYNGDKLFKNFTRSESADLSISCMTIISQMIT